jgi:hypothetical protein
MERAAAALRRTTRERFRSPIIAVIEAVTALAQITPRAAGARLALAARAVL